MDRIYRIKSNSKTRLKGSNTKNDFKVHPKKCFRFYPVHPVYPC
jgi:hypothetical protein